MNAVEIEQAVSDLAAQPFDGAEFPYAFLEAFGTPDAGVRKLRSGDMNKSDVGGLLQRNHIHILVARAGEVSQAMERLRTSERNDRWKVRFLLATDGLEFQAEDLQGDGTTVACEYVDFPDHFGFFLPLAGISTVQQIRESSFDIRATSRLNRLYLELLRDNPEWAKDDLRHEMNHFMARLVFCFFAEDTNIFNGQSLFTSTVETMSDREATNTAMVISEIFRAMNVKMELRTAENVPRWADVFPYVNGGLFSGSTEVPRFSKIARTYLIHIGKLDWTKINPDIFGSMIQAVADDEERGALGMHYTSVPNILKVLNPLFLDDLRTQLYAAGDNFRQLLSLRKRLSKIRVFDPACGSGNFLVIAYKQMREIEATLNERRGEKGRKSEIPLTNFRGIELRDFPAEIARLALIIAEYQCDLLYRGQQEALAEFLPLESQNWITCGNALRLDWLTLCPPRGSAAAIVGDDLFSAQELEQPGFENEGGETYICGNPPYIGSSKQDKVQKKDIEDLLGTKEIKYKNLDYISGWFWLATEYLNVTNSAAAFVTTNSICQGEQVNLLWPFVDARGVEIGFAHTSFKWSNLAANKAGVTCIIIGLRLRSRQNKYLYYSDTRREVKNINHYLLDFENIFIPRHSESISGLPKMLKGNQPSDGGNLILSTKEREQLISASPESGQFLRKLLGSKELIDGINRYCIWIEDFQLMKAKAIPFIAERINLSSQARLQSTAESTRRRHIDAHRFIQIQDFGKRAIVIPEVSSEKREYLPCGLIESDCIATNKLFAIYNATSLVLSICLSKLHRVWVETVCGKLEERISYSNVLGYNTFPVPFLTEKNKAELTRCAEDILLAREAHFPATIADLYDPDTMPQNLREAHQRNDEVLERIYIGRRFKNDTERLEKLFDLYTKMTASARPKAKTTPKPRGKKA
jgi:hypothetical protein